MSTKRAAQRPAKSAHSAKRSTTRKHTVSKASATKAAAMAKVVYEQKAGKTPRSWEPGGREWTRVLGHFGIAAK